jgi:hypothetical protein
VRHLWSNLKTCKLFLVEKEFECIKCKATFNFFSPMFYGFLMPFCFQALTKGKQVSFCCFFTFYCLKQPLKIKIFQNLLRKKKCLQNGSEMACNINSIKTGYIGKKWGFSGTHRICNISKNPNLYPHQSQITLYTLL